MATFALIHGGGEGGWGWHAVAARLARRGHAVVAPDLPTDEPDATWWDCADAVVDALDGGADDLVVAGSSLGGFTAPMVCARTPARLLVLVAAMVPAPGETFGEWWSATGQGPAQAAVVEPLGLGSMDDAVFFHDVPEPLAAEARRRERAVEARALAEPWPLEAWPDVPTRVIAGSRDRMFPPGFQRAVARERLGVEIEEIDAGHYVTLAAPGALADRLAAMAADVLA